MLSKSIRKLVQYGIETGLTPECEKIIQSISSWMSFVKRNIQNRKKYRKMWIWRKLWESFWMRL